MDVVDAAKLYCRRARHTTEGVLSKLWQALIDLREVIHEKGYAVLCQRLRILYLVASRNWLWMLMASDSALLTIFYSAFLGGNREYLIP
jgi:hypothetical protein